MNTNTQEDYVLKPFRDIRLGHAVSPTAIDDAVTIAVILGLIESLIEPLDGESSAFEILCQYLGTDYPAVELIRNIIKNSECSDPYLRYITSAINEYAEVTPIYSPDTPVM